MAISNIPSSTQRALKEALKRATKGRLEQLIGGNCASPGCKSGEARVYRGIAPSLTYPVTVNLCDAHLERAASDGWSLSPQ